MGAENYGMQGMSRRFSGTAPAEKEHVGGAGSVYTDTEFLGRFSRGKLRDALFFVPESWLNPIPQGVARPYSEDSEEGGVSMKNRWWCAAILVAVFALFAAGVPAIAEDEKVIVIAADEWSPYNGAEDGEKPGYGVEIARKVFGDAGYTVVYKVMSWDGAIEVTRAGELDAVIGASQDEVPDFVFPEQEFGISLMGFFVRADSKWTFEGFDSLKGRSLALIADYSYSEELDEYLGKHTDAIVLHVASGEDALGANIGMLKNGSVDIVVEDVNVFAEKTLAMGVRDAFHLAGEVPGGDSAVYVAFSPASPKAERSAVLARMFDEGVKKLRESGELRTILEKYGLEDWKKK